jgi:rhomboid protease GluP
MTQTKLVQILQRLASRQEKYYLVKTLITLNVGWFLFMTVSGVDMFSPDPRLLVRYGAMFGPYVYQGETWRLFSCQFVHIGLIHLAFNMYVLYAIGRDLEIIYGMPAFILIYLFSGTCGSLASLWAHPEGLMAGASGAIFGVVGAAVAFYLRLHDPALKKIFVRWAKSMGMFIVYNTIFGLMVPGIDHYAHTAGLVAGFGMGYLVASLSGKQNDQYVRLLLGLLFGVALLYWLSSITGVS